MARRDTASWQRAHTHGVARRHMCWLLICPTAMRCELPTTSPSHGTPDYAPDDCAHEGPHCPCGAIPGGVPTQGRVGAGHPLYRRWRDRRSSARAVPHATATLESCGVATATIRTRAMPSTCVDLCHATVVRPTAVPHKQFATIGSKRSRIRCRAHRLRPGPARHRPSSATPRQTGWRRRRHGWGSPRCADRYGSCRPVRDATRRALRSAR